MKKISTLIYSDLQQIFRDKTLLVFLLTPAVLIVFVRFFVPFIAIKFPIIKEYYPIIVMFGGIQTSIMFGFITSFIVLDEKDENVLQAIRVLPISPLYFILYRLSFSTIFSTISAFLMITMAGIAYPGLQNTILLAIQYGLAAPFIMLIITTYAKNKIEGMAFFKGIDLVLLLPMTALFIGGNIKYLFSIVPVFWTYTLFEKSLNNESTILYFIIGTLNHILILTLLFSQFKKRVFDR